MSAYTTSPGALVTIVTPAESMTSALVAGPSPASPQAAHASNPNQYTSCISLSSTFSVAVTNVCRAARPCRAGAHGLNLALSLAGIEPEAAFVARPTQLRPPIAKGKPQWTSVNPAHPPPLRSGRRLCGPCGHTRRSASRNGGDRRTRQPPFPGRRRGRALQRRGLGRQHALRVGYPRARRRPGPRDRRAGGHQRPQQHQGRAGDSGPDDGRSGHRAGVRVGCGGLRRLQQRVPDLLHHRVSGPGVHRFGNAAVWAPASRSWGSRLGAKRLGAGQLLHATIAVARCGHPRITSRSARAPSTARSTCSRVL